MKVNFKVKDNKISLDYCLKNKETYKINKSKNRFSLFVYKKPVQVIGFTSMCKDGKHIILLDYDNTAKWIVEHDINLIQDKYKLPPFYLFTTKEGSVDNTIYGNYHLVCLRKFNINGVFNIINETHSDNAYKTMPLRNLFRSFVLRTSSKGKRSRPTYMGILGNELNLEYEISKPHLTLLKSLYPTLTQLDYTRLDEFKELFKDIYETSNY